jgi:MFS family permease
MPSRNTASPSPAATAFAGFVALAVAMGIGRFAFTPVLPLMQDDHAMRVADAGWLAASNYIGYLLGSLAAAVAHARPASAIRAGLVAIAALTAAMAVFTGFVSWLALRGLAGFASAFVFVAVSAWTLEKLAALKSPGLNAMVYAGVGAGIVGAGLICVAVVHFDLRSMHAWIALGAAALLLTATTWRSYSSPRAASIDAAARRATLAWNAERLRLVLAYGFFGFGYILPATFLPAMAKQSLADPQLFIWSWPIFGAAAALSTFALAALPKSFDVRKAWMGAQIVMAIGVALPLVLSGGWAIAASALSVGGTFMVITAAAMQEARKVAPHEASAFIAAMTAAFALGQIAGPVAVSVLAGTRGEFTTPLILAAVLLVAGAVLLVRAPSFTVSTQRTEDTP